MKRKNVWWLFLQMRIAMPAGFFLIILSLIVNRSGIRIGAVADALLSFPSVIFFGAGITGMIMMGVFASVLNSSDPKANLIEQITNTAAQASFFTGILILM